MSKQKFLMVYDRDSGTYFPADTAIVFDWNDLSEDIRDDIEGGCAKLKHYINDIEHCLISDMKPPKKK